MRNTKTGKIKIIDLKTSTMGWKKEKTDQMKRGQLLFYKKFIADKYDVDIFLGTGGGPEGVIAASALKSLKCNFQGRFLFDTDNDKIRAKKMGINNLTKKYELNEIVLGDSIFCATGITSGEMVSGIKIDKNEFISETLVTHKSSGLKKIIKNREKII